MQDFVLTNLPCSGRILIVADAVTEQAVCTSGSVVEYRLAKARVAGSNPVSCSHKEISCKTESLFCFLLFDTYYGQVCVSAIHCAGDETNKTTQDNEEEDHEKRL